MNSKIAIIGASNRRKTTISELMKEIIQVEVEDEKEVDFSNIIENVNDGYRSTYRKHRLPITKNHVLTEKRVGKRLVSTLEAKLMNNSLVQIISTNWNEYMLKKSSKKLFEENPNNELYYEIFHGLEIVSSIEEYKEFMEKHTIVSEDELSITFVNKERTIVRCVPKNKPIQKVKKK